MDVVHHEVGGAEGHGHHGYLASHGYHIPTEHGANPGQRVRSGCCQRQRCADPVPTGQR